MNNDKSINLSIYNFVSDNACNKSGFVLYNGTVYTPWEKFYGGVAVGKGIINAVFKGNPPDRFTQNGKMLVDCHQNIISPGFIDLHLHGANGYDFTIASPEEIIKATSYHAAVGGTTTMLPTLVSAPLDYIKQSSDKIKKARQKSSGGPHIAGIHLEGPFLNPWYKGAHSEKYLRNPEQELIKDLVAAIGEDLAVITISPELPHALEAISYLSRHKIVSALGHSGATLEEVQKAVNYGLSHAVHTYSAMRRFHHRSPGALGAVLTIDQISAEIVADGIHTNPAAVKLFFSAKPPEKAILVTDALAVCGMADGKCLLGDKTIIKVADRATLEDGTLAGSVITMNQAIAGAVNMTSLCLERILPAATINPAMVLGLGKNKGSLEKGKDADIVVFNADYEVLSTICRGIPFYTAYNNN